MLFETMEKLVSKTQKDLTLGGIHVANGWWIRFMCWKTLLHNRSNPKFSHCYPTFRCLVAPQGSWPLGPLIPLFSSVSDNLRCGCLNSMSGLIYLSAKLESYEK